MSSSNRQTVETRLHELDERWAQEQQRHKYADPDFSSYQHRISKEPELPSPWRPVRGVVSLLLAYGLAALAYWYMAGQDEGLASLDLFEWFFLGSWLVIVTLLFGYHILAAWVRYARYRCARKAYRAERAAILRSTPDEDD